ncbi:hypothetical protein [Oribacterium sp. NK2B42]|uniref:hypothetical protein n=1 Tax=Oribacterium sp. NK2B42 TaxID=689781 RepID=UPI000410DEEC|nr:hypothetical protein [Oribacterium sp. NK2B42]
MQLQINAEQRNQLYKKWKEEYKVRTDMHKEFHKIKKRYLFAYAFILLMMYGAYQISLNYEKFRFFEAYDLYQIFFTACPLFILLLAIHELVLYKSIPDPEKMEIDNFFVFLSYNEFSKTTKIMAMPLSEHFKLKNDPEAISKTENSENCVIIGQVNET